MNEDDPVPQETSDNLIFFLGSFGFLALFIGAGFIVAAVTL